MERKIWNILLPSLIHRNPFPWWPLGDRYNIDLCGTRFRGLHCRKDPSFCFEKGDVEKSDSPLPIQNHRGEKKKYLAFPGQGRCDFGWRNRFLYLAMEELNCPSVLISCHGVRYGLLYKKLNL